MMMDPKSYALQFKNSSLEECIAARDELMEDIRAFEKDPDYVGMMLPSPLTVYLVELDYLKELHEVIAQKIREKDPRYVPEVMSSIGIRKEDITSTDCEAVVNAANEGLMMGGGVCGAIFRAAGAERLQNECDMIGGCETGRAVITSGYDLCRYVIHAVGPVYEDGMHGEPELLRSCYMKALDLAKEKGIESIAFPLISSGIYGYPKDEAWRIALDACRDWTEDHPEHEIRIVFAVIDEDTYERGIRAADVYGVSLEQE